MFPRHILPTTIHLSLMVSIFFSGYIDAVSYCFSLFSFFQCYADARSLFSAAPKKNFMFIRLKWDISCDITIYRHRKLSKSRHDNNYDNWKFISLQLMHVVFVFVCKFDLISFYADFLNTHTRKLCEEERISIEVIHTSRKNRGLHMRVHCDVTFMVKRVSRVPTLKKTNKYKHDKQNANIVPAPER